MFMARYFSQTPDKQPPRMAGSQDFHTIAIRVIYADEVIIQHGLAFFSPDKHLKHRVPSTSAIVPTRGGAVVALACFTGNHCPQAKTLDGL